MNVHDQSIVRRWIFSRAVALHFICHLLTQPVQLPEYRKQVDDSFAFVEKADRLIPLLLACHGINGVKYAPIQ